MEILKTDQTHIFFQFIHSVKYDIADWQVVELTLTEDGRRMHSIEDIAEKINNSFSGKKGRILICNPMEVLAMINMGSETSTTYISKRVERAVPQHSCHIEVGTFMDSFTHIKLDFETIEGAYTSPDIEKDKRIQNVILIADPDEADATALSHILEDFGHVILVNSTKDIYKAYLEHTPDILFLSSEMDHGPNAYMLQKILHYDPKAYVVLIDKRGNITDLLQAIEKGAKSFLLKPLNEQAIHNLVKTCPAFSGSMLTH